MSKDSALSLSWGSLAALRLDGRALRRTDRLDAVLVEVYARMRPAVVAYVYRLVGSTSDAEDILQTAFLSLWDQLQRGAEIRNARSWIYRVVHNLAIDQVRARDRRETSESMFAADQDAAHASAERSGEAALVLRSELAHAMSVLSPRERECLLLRAEGLSYQEIADVLQTSAKAVSVHLTRGLRKFAHHHDDPA
jgi:RNA polymerase sigma-70 factor (ECF subfamily)